MSSLHSPQSNERSSQSSSSSSSNTVATAAPSNTLFPSYHSRPLRSYHIDQLTESDPLLIHSSAFSATSQTRGLIHTNSSGNHPRPSSTFCRSLFLLRDGSRGGFTLTVVVAILILTVIGLRTSSAYQYPAHPNLDPAKEWEKAIRCTPREAWLPLEDDESPGNHDSIRETVSDILLLNTGHVRGVIRIEAQETTSSQIRLSTHFHSTSYYNLITDLISQNDDYYRRRMGGPAYPMDPQQCLIIASRLIIPAQSKQIANVTLSIFSEFADVEIDMSNAQHAFRHINVTLVRGSRLEIKNTKVDKLLEIWNLKGDTFLTNISASTLSLNHTLGEIRIQDMEITNDASIQSEKGAVTVERLYGDFNTVNIHSHARSINLDEVQFPNSTAFVSLTATAGSCSVSAANLRGEFDQDTVAGDSYLDVIQRSDFVTYRNIHLAKGYYAGELGPLNHTLRIHSDAGAVRLQLI